MGLYSLWSLNVSKLRDILANLTSGDVWVLAIPESSIKAKMGARALSWAFETYWRAHK
jgi:hypothetical protein